ncbi:RES domain-containing protein [Pedobacter paludis]|uniref:RES domain-containing protein n=1 Tax=Pedobacter paludis TaxID=2203212 RepID=A0A317F474_9SPHI|nr:RES domain-containing protein [Pedobacter paludis]PWS33362.1 hypothetical protein DF947_01680 [Pedobacter paludis]
MSEKIICDNCIQERYLRETIARLDEQGVCDFCGLSSYCIGLDELTGRIDEAFTQHFELSFEDEQGENPGSGTVAIIMDIAGIDEVPAKAIKDKLEEIYYNFDDAAAGILGEYSDDVYYLPRDPDVRDLEIEWREFEKTLKTEARFFNSTGLNLLNSVFDRIEEFKSADGLAVLRTIGPGTDLTSLSRARVFQSPSKLKKAMEEVTSQLGPPPSEFAVAGRMNAAGISVFYGADSIEGAIAEVRPPIGAQVLIGDFVLDRKINVLDLTAIPVIKVCGSYFDEVFNDQKRKSKFLQTLASQMAQPVLPDDQASAYLVTQAIADFLASKSPVSIDGIIYPSVQSSNESKNIMLFHKAARVDAEERSNLEIEAEVIARDEDGYYPDYQIIKTKTIDKRFPRGYISDKRRITLKLNQQSLAVYHLRSVDFKMQEFPVRILERTEQPPSASDYEMPF